MLFTKSVLFLLQSSIGNNGLFWGNFLWFAGLLLKTFYQSDSHAGVFLLDSVSCFVLCPVLFSSFLREGNVPICSYTSPPAPPEPVGHFEPLQTSQDAFVGAFKLLKTSKRAKKKNQLREENL